MKRSLSVLGIAGVILLAGLGYYYFTHTDDLAVALQFSNPSSVLVGQPFTLTISYSNNSSNILQDAKLSLVIPDDVVLVGQDATQRVTEQALGDVGPGSIGEKSFNLIAVGGPQSSKHLQAKFLYSTAVSGKTQFESSAATDVAVGTPALNLTVTTPAQVLSGQQFEISVKYENQSDQDLNNLQLALDYPSLFQYQSSSITPERGNEKWDLGALRRGENGELTIKGIALGSEGASFDIRSTFTSDFLGKSYPLTTQTVTVGMAASPLSFSIERSGGSPDIAHIGETMNYLLHYKNNSSVPMENAVVSATLSGEMFDFSTLKSDGAFNAGANTVTWSVANVPGLAAISPGGEGTLQVSLNVKNAFDIRRVSDKNYFLRMKAQIQSPTVPPDTTSQGSVSVARLDTKVGDEVMLNSYVLVREPKSGISNSGPYPPRANVQTQYTVHWTITNYAGDLQNVHLSAFLQSGARFTGTVKSNMNSAPVYNDATGEVTWDIASIPATKGIISPPAEGIFQISQTPAANQVGQSVTLLGETGLQATDVFTSSTITEVQLPLTSDAPIDDSFPSNLNRRVQP